MNHYHKRIGIVGAGIGGLASAIALRLKGFKNVSVFEKDLSFDERRQGYGLTILQGKAALKSLGVLERAKNFNSHAKAHYIFDSKGSVLGFYGPLFWDHRTNGRSHKSIEKGLSMHIPRQDLRQILLQSWQQLGGQVNWAKTLTTIKSRDTFLQVGFQSQYHEFDLLVGADGIFSKVRQMFVSEEKTPLKDMGVLVTLGICGSTHHLNNQRIFQTVDGQTRIFSMPFRRNDPSANCMWQLSFPFVQASPPSPERLRSLALQKVGDWHSPVPQLVKNTPPQSLMGVKAYDREPTQGSLSNERVVLLGDAAHPMSPFKGQGANQALLDAIDLGESLSKDRPLDESVKAFNQTILDRVRSKVIKSRQRAEQYHNPQYAKIQTFLYPGIDKQLIELARDKGISSTTANIEERLISLLKLRSVHK